MECKWQECESTKIGRLAGHTTGPTEFIHRQRKTGLKWERDITDQHIFLRILPGGLAIQDAKIPGEQGWRSQRREGLRLDGRVA